MYFKIGDSFWKNLDFFARVANFQEDHPKEVFGGKQDFSA